MSTTNYDVKWAVYGAFYPSVNNYQVEDVTAALQEQFENGATSVQMGNGIFGDPCPGIHKCWSACIDVDGLEYLFAGQEDEVVNFATLPAPQPTGLQVGNLQAQLVSGGWPNPQNNFLFSGCGFSITNNTGEAVPPSSAPTPYVSVDFYFSTSNSMNQQLSELIKIGDAPASVTLQNQQQTNYSLSANDRFNMGRNLTGNPALITPGTAYYLYAQVRSNNNSQKLTGSFSQGTYTPTPPQN
jgi:hypothetical protein